MRSVLNLFPAAALFAAALSFGVAQTPARTVLDGVYTADQSIKGEEAYEKHCVRCHEGNDPEGPTLMGRTFVDRWREDNLDVLFDFLKARMPADGAGTLNDSTYLQLVTYLLHLNGYPEGRELGIEALERIRFVGKDGPKPLPPNTLVKVVGCMARDSAGNWSLTHSTEPVRTRDGKSTLPEELKKSSAEKPGTLTFRLQNFVNIAFDFKPDPFVGHKVQVKGVLIRQSAEERISLTALDSLVSVCSPAR